MQHSIGGGVINLIPVLRADALGAEEICVMHVGHVDDEVEVPKQLWDVAVVAFVIARRHRFTADLAASRTEPWCTSCPRASSVAGSAIGPSSSTGISRRRRT